MSRERSRTLAKIAPALAARGHDVVLIVENLAGPSQARIEADAEAPVWELTDKSSARVLAEVQHWRPDLCFLQGFANPALQVELLDRFPTVLFAHNYHGTCISGTKRFAFPVERPCDRVFGPACLCIISCGNAAVAIRFPCGSTIGTSDCVPSYCRAIAPSSSRAAGCRPNMLVTESKPSGCIA